MQLAEMRRLTFQKKPKTRLSELSVSSSLRRKGERVSLVAFLGKGVMEMSAKKLHEAVEERSA